MLFQELRIVVNRNNFVVLDTETTGLSSGSQICQIAVIILNTEKPMSEEPRL